MEKKKKAGHTHATTDDALSYDKNDQDKDYADWGSISLGGFMFHQHGEPFGRSYHNALLQPAPKNTTPALSGRWTDATNHLMQQSGMKGKMDPNWILLDSESTINMFCNADLLTNIRRSKYSLDIYSTTGKSTTDWIGDLPGFSTVWLYPDGTANILSLAKVAKKFPVIYDSSNGQGFIVHKPDGSVR
eukprot:7869808-Ditylum_brightwellii.AAC.1